MAAPNGSSSYIQIGNHLRMRLPAAAPPFSGVPAAAAAAEASAAEAGVQSVTAPAVGGARGRAPRGYNPWAGGMLHVSDATVTIQNMSGIQIVTPRQIAVDTPAGTAVLSPGGQPHIRLSRQVTLTDFATRSSSAPARPS